MRKSHVPEARKSFKARRKELLIDLLGGSCVNCGSTDKLEFDHVIPEDKSFSLAVKLENSFEELLPEVQKCQLLCEKCHMDKTISDRGQDRAKHGTSGMYTNHSCRCALCTSNWATYSNKYTIAWRLRKAVV